MLAPRQARAPAGAGVWPGSPQKLRCLRAAGLRLLKRTPSGAVSAGSAPSEGPARDVLTSAPTRVSGGWVKNVWTDTPHSIMGSGFAE